MKTFTHPSIAISCSILFFSCTSFKHWSFYEDNDSYVNAKQERKKKMEQLAQQKKIEEARKKFIQDSIAQAEEKMKNNPYYKEPNYNKEDYYDYEYAARIKRFYNPVPGLGYYDNWYTNYGFYGTPNYGSSIYMGYGNAWPYMGYGYNGLSSYWSYGLGLGWGNPYSYSYGVGYSPYSYYGYYSPYFYSPYYYGYSPYGYSPYYYGYSPYGSYNPYYYNSQDINSMTYYAPRSSHEGFNSLRTSNNIHASENNFSKTPLVISPEMSLPKFDETARPKIGNKDKQIPINVLNAPLIHQMSTNPDIQSPFIPRHTIINNHANVNTSGTIGVPQGNHSTSSGRPPVGNPIPVSPQNNNYNFQNNSTNRNRGGGVEVSPSSAPKRGGGGGGSIGRPR